MNRTIAPEIRKIKSIQTGFPVSDSRLYIVPSQDEVFKLDIIFPGSGYGVSENKFNSIYGMDLILSGTSDTGSTKIAENIDQLGAYVFKSSDYYESSISIYGINDHLKKILSLVKKSYENCIYPENEVSIFKDKKVSELNINLNKTSYLANRGIHDLVFGSDHNFSKHLDHEIIAGLNSSEFKANKIKYLQDPYFIFTGQAGLGIADILEELNYKIADPIDFQIDEPIPKGLDSMESLIKKENSTQNSIRFGKILPGRSHKDYFKLSLMNLVFGGYFGSRLMKNIREEKGLTYGIHSSISPFKNYSLFKISSECNKDLSALVKEEILKEAEILRTSLITEDELETAKNYLSGHLLRSFDGAFNISDRFRSVKEAGLSNPDEFYKNYFEEINAIKAEDLLETANNYLKTESLKICISGDI